MPAVFPSFNIVLLLVNANDRRNSLDHGRCGYHFTLIRGGPVTVASDWKWIEAVKVEGKPYLF